MIDSITKLELVFNDLAKILLLAGRLWLLTALFHNPAPKQNGYPTNEGECREESKNVTAKEKSAYDNNDYP